MNLRGASAFVTGATGFVGGRLIESLVTDHGVSVKALVHGDVTGPGTFRAARLGIELVAADILDEAAMKTAIAGCDLVFHCAFGSHGTIAEQRRVTVGGTAAVLAAASSSGTVSRFINLSTTTVHGCPDADTVNEQMPPSPSPGWPYPQDKWAAEQLVASSGLPWTTIRLPSVYGPGGFSFTIHPLMELKAGKVVLVNDGKGQLNPVFVDDVVRAMLLAATRSETAEETFLINGPAPVTRRELYDRYQKMLRVEGRILGMTPAEIRGALRQQKWAATRSLPGSAVSALKRSDSFKSALGNSILSLPARMIWKQARRSEVPLVTSPESPPLPVSLPPEVLIDFYASETCFDDSKARRLLGYQPEYSLEQGMALTEQWARWARLID